MYAQITRIGYALALVGILFGILACGEASPSPPVPAGATTGLNTFIFVYTDT